MKAEQGQQAFVFGPGETLGSRRLELGLSLEEVSRITRLTPRTLEHLEAEEWDQLPAPVYVKGFLRAYATVLNLDPEALVAQYASRLAESEPPSPTRILRPAPRRRRISLALILALAGALILWIIVTLVSPDQNASMEEAAGPARDVVALGRPGAPAPDEGGNGESPKTMVLDVFAQEDTWVKAIVDERQPVEHRLSKGERIVLTATDRFNLLVGDPAAIRLELDGQPVPVTGPPGKPVNIRIPAR